MPGRDDVSAIVNVLLKAWGNRDWGRFQSLLAADVELLSFYEPGQWECRGPAEVVEFLAHHELALADEVAVMIDEVDDETVVVSPADRQSFAEHRASVATVVTVRAGCVVGMQRYRSRGEALSAARS